MNTEYKKESQSEIVCYQCGHSGHIVRFCKSNNKNRRGQWCNTCHNSPHSDRACRCKGKNKTDKVKQMSETLGILTKKQSIHLRLRSTPMQVKVLQRRQMLYWWIVVQLLTSSMMNPNLAIFMTNLHQRSATSSNNVALKRGDVEIAITRNRVNAILKH